MVRTVLIRQLMSWAKMAPLVDQVVTTYGRSDKVKIKNLENTEKLLTKIVSGGPQLLQVITDFDATLTRYHLNGQKCDSSYGIIANSPLVPAKLKSDAWELFEKYYPIETDVTMSREEKTPFMIEWYEKSHVSFLANQPRLKLSQLSEMVKNSKAFLRENTQQFLQALHAAKIPVLVLSAGMGNLVEEVLRLNSVNYPNLKVIANFMEFDEAGVLKGFSDPVVHVYNKNEAVLHNDNTGYFEDLKCRHNVILMGDSLGDTNMATGVKDVNAILKIGFLNTKVEDHLSAYMDNYDVVLIDDQSMDFVNSIMNLIVGR